jgi:hypothetical protein
VTSLGDGVALTCKLVYLAILVRYYDEYAPVEAEPGQADRERALAS